MSNFRHFQGGAPDLLFIRAYHKESQEFINLDRWLGSDWKFLGSQYKAGKRFRDIDDLTSLEDVESHRDLSFILNPETRIQVTFIEMIA